MQWYLLYDQDINILQTLLQLIVLLWLKQRRSIETIKIDNEVHIIKNMMLDSLHINVPLDGNFF
jgi:hypothetical protein